MVSKPLSQKKVGRECLSVIRFPLNSFKGQPNECAYIENEQGEDFFSRRDKTRHAEKMCFAL